MKTGTPVPPRPTIPAVGTHLFFAQNGGRGHDKIDNAAFQSTDGRGR